MSRRKPPARPEDYPVPVPVSALVPHAVEDAVLARLDVAEAALREADPELARAVRDQADAATLLARARRLDQVARRAAALRLKAEARLGELHPAEDPATAGREKGGDPRSSLTGGVEADRHERKRWREVAELAELGHLDAYLAWAGEQDGREGVPSREGLRRFARSQEPPETEPDPEPEPPPPGPLELLLGVLEQALAGVRAVRLPQGVEPVVAVYQRSAAESLERLLAGAGEVRQVLSREGVSGPVSSKRSRAMVEDQDADELVRRSRARTGGRS